MSQFSCDSARDMANLISMYVLHLYRISIVLRPDQGVALSRRQTNCRLHLTYLVMRFSLQEDQLAHGSITIVVPDANNFAFQRAYQDSVKYCIMTAKFELP